MQNLDQNQSANEEHTVQTLETELEKMKQEKCEQQRMIDELNIQMNEYKEQNLKLKEQLCEETEKNAQHRTSIEYLESDFQMLLNKIEKLHAQIENLKRDLEIANNIKQDKEILMPNDTIQIVEMVDDEETHEI